MYPKEDLAALPRSTVTETAEALLDMQGAQALDIGCGAGPFTLFLARHCAIVAGIDPNEVRIAAARVAAAEEKLAIDFEVARAEYVPFEDDRFDIVSFSNSLHHVPPEGFGDAMREAARVLVSGGVLWVAEPLPIGAHYELTHLWNNETDIRERAYEALAEADSVGLEMTQEVFFSHPSHYADFDEFVAARSARRPRDAERFRERYEEIRTLFESRARPNDGYLLDRATRVNLLVKRG